MVGINEQSFRELLNGSIKSETGELITVYNEMIDTFARDTESLTFVLPVKIMDLLMTDRDAFVDMMEVPVKVVEETSKILRAVILERKGIDPNSFDSGIFHVWVAPIASDDETNIVCKDGDASRMGKMVSLKGTVKDVDRKRVYVSERKITCASCRSVSILSRNDDFTFTLPKTCINMECTGYTGSVKWIDDIYSRKYKAVQRVQVESKDMLPGERYADVFDMDFLLPEYLAHSVKNGDEVIFSGTVTPWSPFTATNGSTILHEMHFQVLGVNKIKQGTSRKMVTHEINESGNLQLTCLECGNDAFLKTGDLWTCKECDVVHEFVVGVPLPKTEERFPVWTRKN